jgi:hypothetical protein
MKSKLGMVLLWILVFLLGGIAGAVSHHLYKSYMPPSREDILNKWRKDLKKDLKLDERQADSIMAIFDERFKRKQALIQELRPQFDAIRNESNDKIRGILSDEQQKLFEERLKRIEKRRTQYAPPAPPPSKAEEKEKLLRELVRPRELSFSPATPSPVRKKETLIWDPPLPPPLPTPSRVVD